MLFVVYSDAKVSYGLHPHPLVALRNAYLNGLKMAQYILNFYLMCTISSVFSDEKLANFSIHIKAS